MQNIYFGAIFAAIVVYLIVATLLFIQRKKGERSRTMLAAMTGLSVLIYIALRNFKEITGMTPSEYFQRQAKGE